MSHPSSQAPSPLDALLHLGPLAPPQTIDPALVSELSADPWALLRLALDLSLRQKDKADAAFFAPIHALSILRNCLSPAFFRPLHRLLGRSDTEIRTKALECFDAAGESEIAFLQEKAADWSLSPTHRLSSIEALSRIAKREPSLRLSIVQTMASLLDRPDAGFSAAEEEINDRLILALYQMKAQETLASIQRAYEEGRTTAIALSLDQIRQAFQNPELPASPPRIDLTKVRLALRCLACGRERLHALRHVFYDMDYRPPTNTPSPLPLSPLFIPEKVTCPKCHEADRYEISSRGHIEVTIQMMRMLARQNAQTTEETEPLTNGPIRFISFQKYIGRPLHPREALPFFSKAVSDNPKDPKARINYAQVLKLHQRSKEADRELYEATQIEPTNPEPFAWLGQMAEESGHYDEAFHWWTKAGEAADESPSLAPQDKRLWLSTMRQRLELCYDEIALRLRPGQPHPFGAWKERVLNAEKEAKRKKTLSKTRR